MANIVTFNYFKGGIIGHASVTISDGETSVSLSSSADISGIPMGVYSTSHELFRKWSGTNVIEKSVEVDDATFAQIKTMYEQVRETRSDYGYLFGTNCLDFTNEVHRMIGGSGNFADLFSKSELDGPVTGFVVQWVGVSARASDVPQVTSVTQYRDLVQADFGVSGGIVLAVTLAFALLLARPPRRIIRLISTLRLGLA